MSGDPHRWGLESSGWMERETGFEPATSTLARLHSTTELFPLAQCSLWILPKRAIKLNTEKATNARHSWKSGSRAAALQSAPPGEDSRGRPHAECCQNRWLWTRALECGSSAAALADKAQAELAHSKARRPHLGIPALPWAGARKIVRTSESSLRILPNPWPVCPVPRRGRGRGLPGAAGPGRPE